MLLGEFKDKLDDTIELKRLRQKFKLINSFISIL